MVRSELLHGQAYPDHTGGHAAENPLGTASAGAERLGFMVRLSSILLVLLNGDLRWMVIAVSEYGKLFVLGYQRFAFSWRTQPTRLRACGGKASPDFSCSRRYFT